MILVPEELKHIARIFEMYTIDMFSTDLISKQITFSTGKRFSSSTICKILKNKRYTGSFNYRGETYENLGFIPTVTTEMFDIAQERLTNNFKKMNHNYLFYKKLVCSCCGKTLGNKSTRTKGNVYLYYMCETVGCKCSKKRINQDWNGNTKLDIFYKVIKIWFFVNLVELYTRQKFST